MHIDRRWYFDKKKCLQEISCLNQDNTNWKRIRKADLNKGLFNSFLPFQLDTVLQELLLQLFFLVIFQMRRAKQHV